MRLNTVTHGAPHDGGAATGRPALLIAHGLFGSARNWGVIAKRLSDDRQVLAVDMRNHGDSPWADMHDYAGMADDLAGVIEAQGAPVDLLGHSMGGKAAMVLALTRPDLLRRLVVADIAPVAYGHSQNHLITAMQSLPLADLNTRADADARLAAQVDDPGVRAFLLQSLDLRSQPPRWRLNLSVLADQMPGIIGWPDMGAAPPFDGATLFLTGARSDYVRAEHRAAIRAHFPRARFASLPNAGHWLHAESPRAFEQTVRVFLDHA